MGLNIPLLFCFHPHSVSLSSFMHSILRLVFKVDKERIQDGSSRHFFFWMMPDFIYPGMWTRRITDSGVQKNRWMYTGKPTFTRKELVRFAIISCHWTIVFWKHRGWGKLSGLHCPIYCVAQMRRTRLFLAKKMVPRHTPHAKHVNSWTNFLEIAWLESVCGHCGALIWRSQIHFCGVIWKTWCMRLAGRH